MASGRLASWPLNNKEGVFIEASFIVMPDVCLISFIFAQAPLVAPEGALAFPTAFAGISAYIKRTKIFSTDAVANALYKIESVKSRAFSSKLGHHCLKNLK